MTASCWLACLGLALAPVACAPTTHARAAAHAAAARAPRFSSQRSKPIYDQAVQGMRAIDAMRGSPMTEALATDLGFRCADLEGQRESLKAEPDPIVWRLRTDIDRTCKLDVPLASAQLALDRIQKKRSTDPGAGVDPECRALKLAIADLGASFIGSPATSDVIDKELVYCESTDSVRRVP